MKIYKGFFMVFCIAISLVLLNNVAFAKTRWVGKTQGAQLGPLLRDDVRNRVYALDYNKKALVIIDTQTDKVITNIPISNTGELLGLAMAVDKSNRKIGVVCSDISKIRTIVIITLNPVRGIYVRETILLPNEVIGDILSIAFDAFGHLVVSTRDQDQADLWAGWVYILSSDKKSVLTKFGYGNSLNQKFHAPYIQTDITGTQLYVAQFGLTGQIHKFDITETNAPKYIASSAAKKLNGSRNFIISPRYNELYVIYDKPYGVSVLNTDDLSEKQFISPGHGHATAMATTLSGDKLYITTSSPLRRNCFFEYYSRVENNIASWTLGKTYTLRAMEDYGFPQEGGLAVERFGEKVYVTYGHDFNIRAQVVDIAVSNSTAVNF